MLEQMCSDDSTEDVYLAVVDVVTDEPIYRFQHEFVPPEAEEA